MFIFDRFINKNNGLASDSQAIDTIIRLKNKGVTTEKICVELADDSMRNYISNELGVKTIIRPTRSYPSLIVRAATSYGSEKIIEELMHYGGDSIGTFKLPKKLENNPTTWAKLAYYFHQ